MHISQEALHKGVSLGTLSKQWASRPADQRFLTLDALYAATSRLRDISQEYKIDTEKIRVRIDQRAQDDAGGDTQAGLQLELPTGARVFPSHWSFGQLCGLTQVPAAYLRKLPAKIAGINMQHALMTGRASPVKVYQYDHDGGCELRAMTGPDYGRIFDADVVNAVQRLVNNSAVEWKVPGVMNWSTMDYNPDAEVTLDTTTLYASDRDVFLFLCADRNPIEIGKLSDGSPDLVFRGFYVSNSEVGSRTFSVATMYYRASCCNRILWGVENFHELTFKHTKRAPERFLNEVAPVLRSYAQGGTGNLLEGIKAAKAALVASTDEERVEFLRGRGFTQKDTDNIIASVLEGEGHPMESIWDVVQGITRAAQSKPNADSRFDMEKEAGKLLAQVK